VIPALASYTTVIVACLTIVGGILTYSFQRRADRKHQLVEIRRAAYRAYLSALMDQIDLPGPESLNRFHKCELELFAVASDATIRKVAEFSNYMISTSSNRDHRDAVTHKRLLAEALLTMRRDCFEKSRLSTEEALQLLPMQ
jgi:hypothetical protein